jgi:hypothetical protein
VVCLSDSFASALHGSVRIPPVLSTGGLIIQVVLVAGESASVFRRDRPAGAFLCRSSALRSYWSGRLPAPAVIVFANNCFAVTCHTGHTVIGVAAILPRLVAVAPISERMAASWCCGRWRCGCHGRRCLDWCGGRRRRRGNCRMFPRRMLFRLLSNDLGGVRGGGRGCWRGGRSW